jgi:glycoside/pentoside/hexuronide:cation symporter, GPH family
MAITTDRVGVEGVPGGGDAAAGQARLTFREKAGYSLGDMASNIYFQIFIAFLPIFYTDVFGISAAAVGTMLLVTRIWDAVNDPLMGMIADRTHSRWGKFRPYIAGMCVPFAVIGVLTFTTPDLSDSAKLIYAYVTYVLLGMLYTAVNVPYSALMGVITPSSAERTQVSSFRFVAAFGGQLIVSSFTLGLVLWLGGGSEQLGWSLTMVLYGGLVVVLLLGTFHLTRERVQPPSEQRIRIRDDLKDLTRNLPWLLIGAATIFQLTYIVMRASSIPYYFRYYIGERPFTLLGYDMNLTYEGLTSAFLTTGTMATLAGALLAGVLASRIDKKQVYSLSLIASAALACPFFFLGPEDIVWMFLLIVIGSLFLGFVSVLQWAIYTDCADYGEWKFGRRATGLIMAASLFALKTGLALGGAAVGWILATYGFVPLVEQTDEALTGIRLLMSFYPALFGFIGGLIMLFYPLKSKLMVQIESDLAARRGSDP